MTVRARSLLVSVAAAALLAAAPALAAPASCAPSVHARHHAHHVRRRAPHHAESSASLRVVQQQLYDLGYYDGKIDGVTGPKTRAAIRQFQREHSLAADGVAGQRTRQALASADGFSAHSGRGEMVLGTMSVPMGPSDPNVNPDYAPTLGANARTLSSRFGTVTVSESGSGVGKRYDVAVDGQAVLIADGQPSIITVSPVYNLAREDAVILTTYSPGEGACIYRNHVLVLGGGAPRVVDIDNCTRAFDARVDNGQLFVTFPDRGGDRAVGAVYRLDGGTMHRL